jgi:hypothetical protein
MPGGPSGRSPKGFLEGEIVARDAPTWSPKQPSWAIPAFTHMEGWPRPSGVCPLLNDPHGSPFQGGGGPIFCHDCEGPAPRFLLPATSLTPPKVASSLTPPCLSALEVRPKFGVFRRRCCVNATRVASPPPGCGNQGVAMSCPALSD